MKLGELIDTRTSFIKRLKLSASGRHQFMRATLQGLAQELGSCSTQVFDADLQDCLGYHLLIRLWQVTSMFSNAQLWDNTGASISIVQLLRARVDGVEDEVEAQATVITNLTTVVNNVSANATFRMGSSVAPSGWNSRIGMQVKGGTVGDWRSAGLFLDANASGTRVVLMTSQIVLSIGAEFMRPFVIQDGVMYGDAFVMDWAKIQNVQITWAQIGSAVIDNLIVRNH
jgi:hypothetical protein